MTLCSFGDMKIDAKVCPKYAQANGINVLSWLKATADVFIVRVSTPQVKSKNGAITMVEVIKLRYAQNVALTPYLEMPHLLN